ncbi:MAG TPA: hypothetical protein VF800_02710 [Telluria sp.]|jgi:hypothetical protein
MQIRRSIQYSLVAAVLIATSNTGLMFGLNAGEWASWVQAIGSMAAIGGAFAIANGQHVNERNAENARRAADERQRFKIVLAILTKTETTISNLAAARANNVFQMPPENFETLLNDCEKLLGSVAPVDMPHEDLVLICHGLQQEIPTISLGYGLWRQQIEAPRQNIDTRSAATNTAVDDALKLAKDGSDLCIAQIASRC